MRENNNNNNKQTNKKQTKKQTQKKFALVISQRFHLAGI